MFCLIELAEPLEPHLEDHHVHEDVHRQEQSRLQHHPGEAEHGAGVALGELDARNRCKQPAITIDQDRHVAAGRRHCPHHRHEEIEALPP
jgi:hypothetical protein